jgi:hypothetical protein
MFEILLEKQKQNNKPTCHQLLDIVHPVAINSMALTLHFSFGLPFAQAMLLHIIVKYLFAFDRLTAGSHALSSLL